MKKYKYVYRIINLINGMSYIGQHSTNKEYDSYFGSGSLLKKEIKKYGKNNFIMGIIEYCNNQKELNEKEIFWISKFNTLQPNGYNITKGGNYPPQLFGEQNGFYKKHHTEETKKILSEKRKHISPWNKGTKGQKLQKISEETRKKMSVNNLGKKN